MTSCASPLWRSLQVYQIYGANTNVGKTVVSTLLCKAAAASAARKGSSASSSLSNPSAAVGTSSARSSKNRGTVAFLKPVSTGPLREADDRHIHRYAPDTITRCLYQFKEPVSPHLAAADASYVPRDDEVVSSIHGLLSEWSNAGLRHAFVETAGGVHSPGPSGTSQADLYRPLRLPVILVADYHLGGISSSISAYESLFLRGYDVQSVLMFKDDYYQNSDYLLEFFGRKDIPLLALEQPPPRPEDESEDELRKDEAAMDTYYANTALNGAMLDRVISNLETRHQERLEQLDSMASRAHEKIWYPFTQHKELQASALTVIDSAIGDQFQVYQQPKSEKTSSSSGDQVEAESQSNSVLGPVFDGSASWWTQGLGHGNPELALAAAYAAGRYGHVMFALGAHDPAIRLAELLLENTPNERLTRVFYTDNGSTGMEVAVKMALRAACDRYGWDGSSEEIGILGLKGSYHGDTIGMMDCCEPSTFNKQVEWYRGRGFWFDFPQVKVVRGKWTIEFPAEFGIDAGKGQIFDSLEEIFDVQGREDSELGKLYGDFIRDTVQELTHKHGRKFGAIIMEPIILGAGGMLLADPLFQHMLIQTVRSNPSIISPSSSSSSSSSSAPSSDSSKSWSGVPVVFDEVFTGLYRLFHFTPSTFFPTSSKPDIVVNAKLLTGGLLPLATTMASEDIFTCFNSSPAKEQALLHGHSYTAHPVGCHVANVSVRKLMDMEKQGSWDDFKTGWGIETGKSEVTSGSEIWSVWPQDLLVDLSHAKSVESIWALGTVLSIVLKDESGGGYSSFVAQNLQRQLRSPAQSNSKPLTTQPSSATTQSEGSRQDDGRQGTQPISNTHFDVQSRVLGNVFYLMTSLTSTKREVDIICEMLRGSLL